MRKRNEDKSNLLQIESVEAGTFPKEDVNDILERLASLLISSWEKDHRSEPTKESDNIPSS